MMRLTCIALLLMLVVLSASGQTNNNPATGQVRYWTPSRTTAPNQNYKTSYSAIPQRPANYNYYYYAPQNYGYALTPGVAPNPAAVTPMVLGPVQPYSDVEYSRLVLSTLGVGAVEPASARLETRTIVQEVPDESATPRYRKVEARVVDVLDRGTLLMETGEELKLRGVRVPSERNANDFMRYYAREAMRTMRSLTANAPIYVTLDDPLRDIDGTLMGVVYLQDGTELNRMLLTMGYGEFEPRDFTEEKEVSPLAVAAQSARDSRVGIWSVSY